MSPAQEVLGKRLCDEAQLQEEADGALAQALGKAGGIMDGEVVELTGEVESRGWKCGLNRSESPKG